ncbi:MAG: hypothetical protein JWR85_4180 [Marmoricola sp.]|jgi:hypothetical protein|nr:hypothetical protein [Marmoricola sp.]
MTTTYPQAVNDIFGLITAAWNANAATILGEAPGALRYVGVETQGKQETDKFWARVSTQGVDENQASIANGVGAPGNRRYQAEGLVFIQLFAPKSRNTAMEKLRLLAQLARNAYRGKVTVNGVSFSHVRIQELDPEELWQRINVVAEYAYDEIA